MCVKQDIMLHISSSINDRGSWISYLHKSAQSLDFLLQLKGAMATVCFEYILL